MSDIFENTFRLQESGETPSVDPYPVYDPPAEPSPEPNPVPNPEPPNPELVKALMERLDYYRAHPDEVSTWEEVKNRILSRKKAK